MSSTYTTIEIAHVICGSFQIQFGLERSMQRQRIEDHRKFYCPNGCHINYSGESDKERAEKAAKRAHELLDQERRRTERLAADNAHKERQLSAAKGRITRIRNRVAAGVCPCCNRTFQNLAAHMKGQHPGFTSNPESDISGGAA